MVVYVVDVIVTVPTCWSPNVQKDVGAPLVWLLHGFEDDPSLSLVSEPKGWYSNEAARVTTAGDVPLSARVDALGAVGASADVSASCESGNVVMPWIGARDSDGPPAYGR